jgi:hypothetical protein
MSDFLRCRMRRLPNDHMGFRTASGKGGINRCAALKPYSSAVLAIKCEAAARTGSHPGRDNRPAALTGQTTTGILPVANLRRATS